MSQVQDREGRTPSDVLEYLLDLLKDNDNSLNTFSDNYYLESVILVITSVNSTGVSDAEKIVKQLNRYLSFEKLTPSYHNTVTVACLKAMAELQASKRAEVNLGLFRDYSKYSHFEDVRIAALESLVRLSLGTSQQRDLQSTLSYSFD